MNQSILGGSSAMKRYLAIDVYRAERLITKAKHKELKASYDASDDKGED